MPKRMDMDLSTELYLLLCPEPRQCYRFQLGALFWLAARERAGRLRYVEGWIAKPGKKAITHSWLADDDRIVDVYATLYKLGPEDYFPAAEYTPAEARQIFRDASAGRRDISLPFIADDDPLYLAVKRRAEERANWARAAGASACRCIPA